jgi:hypothetical protein
MAQRFRGAIRPSFAHQPPSSKAEGAGKAGWPLHPGLPRKRNLRERAPNAAFGDRKLELVWPRLGQTSFVSVLEAIGGRS